MVSVLSKEDRAKILSIKLNKIVEFESRVSANLSVVSGLSELSLKIGFGWTDNHITVIRAVAEEYLDSIKALNSPNYMFDIEERKGKGGITENFIKFRHVWKITSQLKDKLDEFLKNDFGLNDTFRMNKIAQIRMIFDPEDVMDDKDQMVKHGNTLGQKWFAGLMVFAANGPIYEYVHRYVVRGMPSDRSVRTTGMSRRVTNGIVTINVPWTHQITIVGYDVLDMIDTHDKRAEGAFTPNLDLCVVTMSQNAIKPEKHNLSIAQSEGRAQTWENVIQRLVGNADGERAVKHGWGMFNDLHKIEYVKYFVVDKVEPEDDPEVGRQYTVNLGPRQTAPRPDGDRGTSIGDSMRAKAEKDEEIAEKSSKKKGGKKAKVEIEDEVQDDGTAEETTQDASEDTPVENPQDESVAENSAEESSEEKCEIEYEDDPVEESTEEEKNQEIQEEGI